MKLKAGVTASATLSPCGTYRYTLTRAWATGPFALWIMLNPSTADADMDDPTIRRCMAFSRTWDFAGCTVVNLFALRATKPGDLLDHPDPVGPENNSALWDAVTLPGHGLVVAAWGTVPSIPGRIRLFARPDYVLRLCERSRRTVHCLGRTASGQPRHPLYVKADVKAEVYR